MNKEIDQEVAEGAHCHYPFERVENYSFLRLVSGAGAGWWSHRFQGQSILSSYQFYQIAGPIHFGWLHSMKSRTFMRFDLRNGQWNFVERLSFAT